MSPENTPEPSPVEMVRKVYARDLREKDRVHTVFRVAEKGRHVARSGKPFLILALADKTGRVDARIFDRVDELEPKFVTGDYLLLQGHAISFHGKPQLVIESLERLDPEPIDAAEFAEPTPPPTPEKPEAAPGVAAPESAAAPATHSSLRELAERLHDRHLKALAVAILDDSTLGALLSNASEGKHGPHAHKGGLALHAAAVIRLAQRIADQYPMVDRDLLTAGGVVRALGRARDGDTGDEARLLGPELLAVLRVQPVLGRLEGFPPALAAHVLHVAAADDTRHPPTTLEALLLTRAEALEGEVASWLDAMSRDPHERWTEPSRLGRAIWKAAAPTARGRPPLEGRRRPRPERKRREPSVESRPPEPPAPGMSFKPLAALTGEPAAAPVEPPSDT